MVVAVNSEALLKRLEWTVIRRLDGLLQGDYRTLWRGAGLDLADLREYQHHDDVRHIDWNVTARLQQSSSTSARASTSVRTREPSAASPPSSSPFSRGCSRATATASVRCSTATKSTP
jgi:hypothetical protein